MENAQLSILLADDDEGDRYLFNEAFSELELAVNIHVVTDGIQLMNYLNKGNTPLPNLLFLDLNMPRKNGFECLKEIRGNEKLKSISIAIYSTSASEKDIEETFRNGANIYIKKPSDFIELGQVLYKVIMGFGQYRKPPNSKADFFLKL